MLENEARTERDENCVESEKRKVVDGKSTNKLLVFYNNFFRLFI